MARTPKPGENPCRGETFIQKTNPALPRHGPFVSFEREAALAAPPVVVVVVSKDPALPSCAEPRASNYARSESRANKR
jgi:hypothetical protein